MRGLSDLSETHHAAARPTERDPSSVGYAATFSRKGRRLTDIRHHGPGEIVVRPTAVRAFRAGRYMSRAWAPGSRNSPGVTARAT